MSDETHGDETGRLRRQRQITAQDLRHTLTIVGLRRCDRGVQELLQPGLARLGITMTEFRIVGVLLGEERGLMQREVAARLGVEPPSLSVSIRKLEAKGVVERTTDPDDGRVKRVRCCAGAPAIEHALELIAKIDARATEGMSDEEVVLLRGLLAKVHHNLTR